MTITITYTNHCTGNRDSECLDLTIQSCRMRALQLWHMAGWQSDLNMVAS